MAADSATIDRYGVMGHPVSHSRSPIIHRLFAAQTAQVLQYELLQVSPDKLEQAIRQFQRTGGKGLNITVPHKREVCRFSGHGSLEFDEHDELPWPLIRQPSTATA